MADNNQGGGKKNAPAPPDYQSLAQQQAQQQHAAVGEQTQANRPNISTPFAGQQWTQGPDGQWNLSTGFGGPLAGAASSLEGQAADSLSTPFSLSSLGTLGTGDSAREQAISSAYTQATSRLDPQWTQREEALRSRLANQGLQEGSEAYNHALEEFGRDRNDAYGGAMANAINQGTEAGTAVFNQNMASRQQALSELLRQREQPLSEIQGMQGLLSMPSFNSASLAESPNLLQAGGMQDAANYRNWQANQQARADAYGAGTQLAGQGLSLLPFFLSDERAKVEVRRLPVEVVPGVSLATFRYRPEVGLGTELRVGVVAQDLRGVLPQAVRARADGLLEVHPAFAPLLLEN